MIDEILTRGVANIIPGKPELKKLLESGKKLNIYLGIDPTMTKIHLGHALPLRKLVQFANLNHNVTFLIGDFTTLVGDTSDKNSERPILTKEEIINNFQTYKQQAEKIIDFSKVKIVYNSEWLDKLGFSDIIKLTQQFSLNDFISRELIRNRLQEGKRVRLDEVLYPIMQGYDSLRLNTDIQLGGTDQTFNMQAGRTLIKNRHNKESFIISNVFLSGTDGRKMSKSWGNAIWINDDPFEMYTKVMAIKDDLIMEYFTLATNLSMEQINTYNLDFRSGKNPMELKKILAYTIVNELHNKEAAESARENFEKTVQKKELPIDIPTVNLNLKQYELDELLLKTQLVSTKSEAKRLVLQGGVDIDGKRQMDLNSQIDIKNGSIIKVGKRRIVKVIKSVS